MAEQSFDYTVRVTVDPAAWQDVTGSRPGPYIKEMLNDFLREHQLVLDVDVRTVEPVKVVTFEEI